MTNPGPCRCHFPLEGLAKDARYEGFAFLHLPFSEDLWREACLYISKYSEHNKSYEQIFVLNICLSCCEAAVNFL